MLKPVEKDLEITEIRLLEKRGGRSSFRKEKVKARAAVVVVSDSVASGKKEDRSGKMILERLKEEGIDVGRYEIIPDEPETLENLLRELVAEGYDLILTTGGTGFSLRDHTPEATKRVIEREAPGISEFVRMYGGERTPYSMLSRAVAGISGRSLLVNLPGSRAGVRDALNALFPYIFHAFKVMKIKGGGHVEGK
jgi:molybdenum cofactor synthesis domain-containing protein